MSRRVQGRIIDFGVAIGQTILYNSQNPILCRLAQKSTRETTEEAL